MGYEKALALLEAYEPKELCARKYKHGEHCCAIGVVAPEFRKLRGIDCEGFVWDLAIDPHHAPNLLPSLQDAGLTLIEARELQLENDTSPLVERGENVKANRRARYTHVVNWLREQTGGAK